MHFHFFHTQQVSWNNQFRISGTIYYDSKREIYLYNFSIKDDIFFLVCSPQQPAWPRTPQQVSWAASCDRQRQARLAACFPAAKTFLSSSEASCQWQPSLRPFSGAGRGHNSAAGLLQLLRLICLPPLTQNWGPSCRWQPLLRPEKGFKPSLKKVRPLRMSPVVPKAVLTLSNRIQMDTKWQLDYCQARDKPSDNSPRRKLVEGILWSNHCVWGKFYQMLQEFSSVFWLRDNMSKQLYWICVYCVSPCYLYTLIWKS